MEKRSYTLGIDPAKKKFTVGLLDPDGGPLAKPLDCNATADGYQHLENFLNRHVAAGATLYVGVERAASLDDNVLAWFMQLSKNPQAKFRVQLLSINPALLHKYSEAKPRRGSHDGSVALRAARYTRQYVEQLDQFNSDDETLEMSRLCNEMLALRGDRVALINRLKDRLISSFPELESVCPNLEQERVLALLQKYPTARHLAKARQATLKNFQHCPGAHRLGAQAEKLHSAAQRSIASATSDNDAETIRFLASQIQQIDKRNARIKEVLEAYAKRSKSCSINQDQPLTVPQQIKLCKTMLGIGLVTAALLVLRCKGLTRFMKASALRAQIGTHPDKEESGHTIRIEKLAKNCDRRLRSAIYMPLLSAINHNPALQFHYWRLIEYRKMTKKQAQLACMNRLVGWLHAMIRKKEPYNAQRLLREAQKQHPQKWQHFLQQASPKMLAKIHKIEAGGKQLEKMLICEA